MNEREPSLDSADPAVLASVHEAFIANGSTDRSPTWRRDLARPNRRDLARPNRRDRIGLRHLEGNG